eukprot:6212125-Pleurochrysis_carterae.AAC.3
MHLPSLCTANHPSQGSITFSATSLDPTALALSLCLQLLTGAPFSSQLRIPKTATEPSRKQQDPHASLPQVGRDDELSAGGAAAVRVGHGAGRGQRGADRRQRLSAAHRHARARPSRLAQDSTEFRHSIGACGLCRPLLLRQALTQSRREGCSQLAGDAKNRLASIVFTPGQWRLRGSRCQMYEQIYY